MGQVRTVEAAVTAADGTTGYGLDAGALIPTR